MNTEGAPLGADPRQMEGALRSQLGDIAAASQLLLRSAREGDRRYLAVIDRAASRCARLLREGELARRLADEDELRAVFATADLAAWCREICEASAPLLERAGIRLTWTCSEAAIITLADRELLDEMLYALISNAAKAAEEGGSISVALSRRSGSAVLTVGDEGAGLSEQVLERLLGDGAPELDLTPGAGAGLGLRLCRAIAETHGGLLMLETGPGAGARCAVSLPVREGRERMPLRSPRRMTGREQALEALSDVLPPECFMRN